MRDVPLQTATDLPTCFVDVADIEGPLEDGLAMEARLVNMAATGISCARLWRSRPMMVVPRSYRNYDGFGTVQRQWAERRTPICIRQSGGGAVPQGDGILNVSLAWPTRLPALTNTENIYRALCDIVAGPIRGLGINCQTTAVPGSFCDGRFNLSIGGRKVAGTAQYWHRAGVGYVVMAHAMLVVNADPGALTAFANALETALDTGRVYSADALTSVARELGASVYSTEKEKLFSTVASAIRVGLESGLCLATDDTNR